MVHWDGPQLHLGEQSTIHAGFPVCDDACSFAMLCIKQKNHQRRQDGGNDYMMADRIKQSTAGNFKANCSTDKGRKEIRGFLDGLLKTKEPLDGVKKSWCWWLIAGGKSPEEFKVTVKSYDNPTICGLVWNRNFVAYRCRDCGISPCMSICADCFHAGNHEGHDFNMFKSQAGGACDCGDESVMSRSGFCSRHGKTADETQERKPPEELFAMSRIVIPRLCVRLHQQLERVDKESLGANSELMGDANELAEFLMSVCETDTMKNVVAECLMMRIAEVESSSKERQSAATSSGHASRLNTRSSVRGSFGKEDSFDSVSSIDTCDEELDQTYLDFMMDFVTKLEFPQKLITFLLHLLPCKKYKECFTRVFCQHYQKIAKTLVSTTLGGPSVEQLANRVVHVSVQLYSNKHLAEKMVREQNLLHVMVKVLHDMIKPALQPFKRGQVISSQLVVSCDNKALSEHCYWPIVSDFINILSHKSVAEVFLKDHDLIQQWIKFIQYLTGMNISHRKILTHIEFEPTVYYTSFSVELEAGSTPLWSLINACKILDSPAYVRNMITNITDSLKNWYNNSSVIMPRRSEVTFHLPLHRYLSGFLSLAMSHFKMPLEEIVPSQTLLAQMAEHLLQIQAAVCEIRIGRWVRNGSQIRSQMRLYAECHFCNSMIDLDVFLLQVCAAFLDPDYLLDAILERFGVKHWFDFGPLNVPTPSCFDMDTDMSMVEGALNLILNLLNSRLHLGLTHQEVVRQEMVALLCIGDRTHSQLVELIPDKPGQSHKIKEFEETLAEIADYKAPAFENGWMQQGKYAPKDLVWEQHFDPVQVFHRAVQRQDIQSAMTRYSAFISKTSQVSSTSNLWPPFKPLRSLPKGCEGILKMLQCKTLHGMLFYVLYQASQENSSISDSLLYTAVHLTSLALETSAPPPTKSLKPNLVLKMEKEDVGSQIASRCIDHLETHGKNVEDLHQVEDLRHINAELITTLQKDADTPIDTHRFSCHDVCVVMACAVHQIMRPPLFDPFLPFMAQVLNSALNNKSNQNEKVAQLQHIQFLLELLPQHRRNLVKKLSSHLVSVSERFNIPAKNLVLVSDDSQPMELSMLLMYLIKYHDWMFRARSPPLGWPRDILDLDFKSVAMVDNIRHSVGVILPPEPMDTTSAQTAPEGSSSVPSQTPGTSYSTSRPLSQSLDDTPAFRTLVQEFMAITEAPESVARNLLFTCRGNLELAINMHLNMEDTLPVLPDHGPQSTSVERPVHQEAAGASEGVQPTAMNESILSVLWKIRASLTSSSSSSSNFGDALYYINKLIKQARDSSLENSVAVASLSASDNKGVDEERSTGDDSDEAARTAIRRKQARERQQKLLAEFASKQKSFMEKALKRDPDGLEDVSMDIDAPLVTSEVKDKTYECVICGESSPSTEDRPVGLVVLLQPSAVLKHRSLKKQNTSASSEPSQAANCGGFVKARLNALMKLFPKDESLDALSAGCEGGIHAQTCGHYLHVDCQQSYLKSLQEEEASQLHQTQSFSPRNGDFTCPLCRQLGNCVLPEIPLSILPSQNNQKQISHTECLHLQRETLKRHFQNSLTKLTASALNFSVLGASIKSVVEIASMLGTNGEIPKSERQFELLYRTIRTNLELEQVNREARKLSTSRKSCFGSLMSAFHFHCQTLVEPMIAVWSELSDIDIPQDHSKSANNKPPVVPLLLRDAPSLLIQIMLSWTSALSLRDFQCLVQLVYNLVFTQALVHSCCKFVGDERLSWQETGKKALVQKKTQKPLTIDMLLGFVTQTLSSSKLFKEDNPMLGISQSVWSPHMVEQSIRDFCLPYLKFTALISSLCYDTDMPNIETSDQEFQAYAASLQLYTGSSSSRDGFSCADFLKWPHDKPLSVIRKWCESLSSATRRYDTFAKSQDLLPITHQWQPPKMIELPERYDLVIQHYRKLKCTKCNTKPDDPAVCMVCGRFVCLQGMCCFSTEDGRKHECVKHAAECGAGTGVFLIVLSSVIIIIRADRVCIWGSVYLDSFGEEDRDLRRGKPLFLSQDRYDRLQEQWFTHSFDHTCKRWKRHMNTL